MGSLRKMLLAASLAAATFSAGAAGMLDGSKPFICATTLTAVCDRDGECVTGSAESVNLPVMWRIDVGAKTVESLRHGGEQRTSPVTASGAGDGFLVVQGAELGLGWSLSVEQETGSMVLTGGRAQSFTAFGTCVAP